MSMAWWKILLTRYIWSWRKKANEEERREIIRDKYTILRNRNMNIMVSNTQMISLKYHLNNWLFHLPSNKHSNLTDPPCQHHGWSGKNIGKQQLICEQYKVALFTNCFCTPHTVHYPDELKHVFLYMYA